MSVEIETILDVLNDYGISPENRNEEPELPEVGEVGPGEWIFETSVDELSVDEADDGPDFPLDSDGPLAREWWAEIERIINAAGNGSLGQRRGEGSAVSSYSPGSPCAWYSPIHFFGDAWGIYIREQCLFHISRDIARYVDWSRVKLSRRAKAKHLMRAAFYSLFLHEQFHHKVESLGLRLMVAAKSSFYIPYSRNVYTVTFNTDDCLEEALANADSYNRLSQKTYKDRLHGQIYRATRDYLRDSFEVAPPGYRRASGFLGTRFDDGVWDLQTQVREGTVHPNPHALPPVHPSHWGLAPNMTKALMPISSKVFLILPVGSKPFLSHKDIRPGFTATTRELRAALTRHYGFWVEAGGKGSHVKLAHRTAPTVILSNRCNGMSPGVIEKAIKAIGRDYGLNRLPELLNGTLPMV